HVRKGYAGFCTAQEGTELRPSRAPFPIHNEQVCGSFGKVRPHFVVMSAVACQPHVFVSSRAGGAVKPAAQAGLRRTEIIYCARNPTLLVPDGQNEPAARKTVIERAKEHAPGVV